MRRSRLTILDVGNYRVRPLRSEEREWLRETLRERWGEELLVGRGKLRRADELRALIALDDEERVGVVTYVLEGEIAEIVTLDALRQGAGVGRLLVEEVATRAHELGARQLIVMTTNDNVHALRFYQLAGFRLFELRPGAVDKARRVKPSIPHVGHEGIPIRDEIDLVLALRHATDEIPTRPDGQ